MNPERLLAFSDALSVGRWRVGIAIENSGVEFGPVFTCQFSGLRPIGRIMTNRLQILYLRLVSFELLLFQTVSHAGRLNIDEGKSRETDAFLDDLRQARHVRGRTLGHE